MMFFVTLRLGWLLYDYDMMEVNGHMELLTDPWPIYAYELTD